MSTRALLGEFHELVRSRGDEIVGLCQDLVRVPSPSGCEGILAQFILASMQELDYDETWIDAAGNVIGLVKGGDGPTTMFNGHMDIVDAGSPEDWEHSPFEAEVHEGHIWGRGSADMKGGLAAMISASSLEDSTLVMRRFMSTEGFDCIGPPTIPTRNGNSISPTS